MFAMAAMLMKALSGIKQWFTRRLAGRAARAVLFSLTAGRRGSILKKESAFMKSKGALFATHAAAARPSCP